jgi:GntR family transcriptional regulator
MVIEKNTNLPLYKQLELILQDKILFGELSPGILLPTEQELCEQYHMSRITVRNALGNLERSGLINRTPGRGSVVKRRESNLRFGELSSFTALCEAQGYRASKKILNKELVKANADLISLFKDNALKDELFWHFCSLRYLDNEPAVIMNHYVKRALGDKMLEFDLEKCSFIYLFELITTHKIINKGSVIAPVLATPEIAKILHVETGAALMWSRGINCLEGDIPVEVTYSLFIGSKFYWESGNYRPGKIGSSGPVQKDDVFNFKTEGR